MRLPALELAEIEHRAILIHCGFRADDVPGAMVLATALLGHGSVVAVPPVEVWGEGEATPDGIILLRDDLAPARRDFVILHEVAEIWVQRRGCRFGDYREKEIACDAIAGALLAPTDAFREAADEHMQDFERLAFDFGATQTAMALRLGEVTQVPVRVFRPGLVRTRGLAFDWDAGGARRVDLTDEHGRFVELAA